MECATSSHSQVTLKTPNLPFRDIIWVNDNSFVAAGFDCAPYQFKVGNGSIDAGVSLDKGGAAKGAGAGSSNMTQWQNRDKLGAADGAKDQSIDTQHQNCITNLQAFAGQGNLTAVSSSGLDGGVAIWKF